MKPHLPEISKFKSEFTSKYGKGTIIETDISNIILPSQIITEFYGGFTGRLSVLDMSWCLPDAEEKLRKLAVGDKIQCVVIDIDFDSKHVVLSQKHLVQPLSNSMLWERIERGDESKAVIVDSLNDNYVIKTEKGIFGLLHKSFLSDFSNDLKVKVNSKLDNSDLILFVPASVEIEYDSDIDEEQTSEFSFVEDDLQSFNKFKISILGRNATDDQCEIIQTGFDADPNIFSKEFSSKHTLFIQFELNSFVYESIFKQQAIPYFTDGSMYSFDTEKLALERLSKQSFWFKIYNRVNKKKSKEDDPDEVTEFSLFNNDISILGHVLVSKDKKEHRFVIINLSFGQKYAGAARAKKKNARDGSFLFANQLRILSPLENLPIGSSQKEILEYALLKSGCFELIKSLKLDAGEILKHEGRTLGIIDKFLEYQISLIDGQKENNVHVTEYSRIHSHSGGLSIQLPNSVGDSMEIEEDTVVNIRIKKEDDLLKLTDGVLSYKDNTCKITFYKEVNLDLLNDGFYVDKRISKRQFQIQREIIQDFLEKKIRIDHIEALLVNPDKVKTPENKKIAFKNPDLTRTELEDPENLQPLAVRKAIGCKDILLIQGPPGTGKTTVIAEIIEQLVEKGEKILVAGQNHVAVDNVLAKIAKISSLNLLRIGNPDKVDKDLVRYCIDNLLEDYKGDYSKFIENQLKLTTEYLMLKNAGIDKDTFTKNYNSKVNELIGEYGKLKEIFKQRHFLLRDGLSELNTKEICDSIESLESWIDSNNNDYEILLKPLIYNSVDVVFATCIGIKGDDVFKESNFKFNTVIIDEAGKANIGETLVAIELGKKVILVGDQMQLPPYIDSNLIDDKEPTSFPKSIYGADYAQDEIMHAMKTSFFEFIINRIEAGQFPQDNKVMLNYQHRMHPNIGKFVSESFYDGLVQMGSRTHLQRLEISAPFDKEIVFFDTSNAANPYEQNDGYSAKNNTEAEAIAEIILPKLFENNISPANIAVIAPYKSQVANIQRYIKSSQTCNFKNIDVSTLDSFQGKEYDIIVFSFTRSANFKKPEYIDGKRKSTKVGFLDDARRLNVAFSRAKKKLIFIGNASTLTSSRSHYDGLFNYTGLFNKLVSLSKNDEIGKFVNIADYSDFKSSFVAFCEKSKVDDIVYGIVEDYVVSNKTGKKIGSYIKSSGVKLFAPYYHQDNVLNKNFTKFSITTEVVCRIISIDSERKSVIVKLIDKLWYEAIAELIDCKPALAEIFDILPNGYLVKTVGGIIGLLNTKFNSTNPRKKQGDKIYVTLSSVDYLNQKVKFKIV